MATVDFWQGDDGGYYSKDEYGNVFDQYENFLGSDAPYQAPYMPPPTYPYQGGGAYSTLGPISISNPGMPSYVSPGFPMTNQYGGGSSGFGGGGGMGGGQQQGVGVQPGYMWEKLELDRQGLAAEIQGKQQYQQYLNQQLAQQGKSDAERYAIEREKLQISRELAALEQRRFALEQEESNFTRGMQISELIANPRSFVQSLMLMGANPAQAAGYLQNTPLVQGLGAPAGAGQQPGWAPPPGGINLQGVQQAFGGLPDYNQMLASMSAASGAGTIDPTTGRNTLFPFIEGKKLPVQQTLQQIGTQSPNIGLLGSLASFSGQNPENFFGEFESYLPKGGTMMAGGYR